MREGKKLRSLATGLGFLAPNILGFLTFTVVPLVFSLVLAFSNWDLKLHNMFHTESIRFIGFENFRRLFHDQQFMQFFKNTLFFMIGIPFGMGGSLLAAILLTQDLEGGNKRVHRRLMILSVGVATALMGTSFVLMSTGGLGVTGMMFMLCCLVGGFFVLGSVGGKTFYRTLFFVPHFTSGVAVFILWKKMYNPQTGPVNNALQAPLTAISGLANAIPSWVIQSGLILALVLIASLCCFGLKRLSNMWNDGDVGLVGVLPGTVFLVLPVFMLHLWCPWKVASWLVTGVVVLAAALVSLRLGKGAEFPSTPTKGLGTGLMMALIFMVLEFVLTGLGIVAWNLPEMAKDGLDAPNWLSDYAWAKPAIMLMGLWGAIGSNNMLLYIAGLSNIPPELLEAADIDGASKIQRFWNITWPQLAPVTFFIFVMSVIGGLQGGFEMARTMTKGGPAGATTTLSYFIYTEGFETGRLGFASAVAWALFALVFLVTIFNWKFGSKYVND